MPKSSDALAGAPAICMVTEGSGAGKASFIASIDAAARAGIDLIQIREPGLDDGRLFEWVQAAIAVTSATRTRVVINDRLDVALAAGAAGVHLRGDSFPAARARGLAPAGFLIGRSVHSENEALAIEAAGGCDYLMFGTVFPSTSKPAGHAVAGLDALARICERVHIPVVAIGGISVERAAAVARAGAAGVAAISLFKPTADIARTVSALRLAFDS